MQARGKTARGRGVEEEARHPPRVCVPDFSLGYVRIDCVNTRMYTVNHTSSCFAQAHSHPFTLSHSHTLASCHSSLIHACAPPHSLFHTHMHTRSLSPTHTLSALSLTHAQPVTLFHTHPVTHTTPFIFARYITHTHTRLRTRVGSWCRLTLPASHCPAASSSGATIRHGSGM